MRYLSTTLLLMVCLCYTAAAQPFVIKGSVADTINNNNLPNASITLMRAGDSVLESFTRSKADGSFSLNAKAKGKYLIMATFPGLVDYVDIVDIKDDKPLDLGQLPLVSKTYLLKEFVMTQQYAAIKVKGDTVEYIADSFKTRDNATVEALLKKLPGIQVDKSGQIVAQGEKVQKVLVDGEEFFTDDPAVVTKSLQAKAVDKVQVFDKKSEQAEFTGIDDGEKTRTINLQLKDDKKRGYFGKLIGGGGAGDQQGFFENQAMFNAFKGKRKLSAFGIMANTGKVGLGWEDRDKFGGGGGGVTEIQDDGSMISYYNSDGEDEFESWSGTYNGQGLPRVWTAGLHYSNKWKQDKHHLGGNYRYSKQDIETTTNTLTEYSLPNNKRNFNKESKDVYSVGQRHRGDGLYEWKIDSTSTLKLTANAGYSNTKSTSIFESDSRNELDSLLSTNDRRITSDATTKSINSTLDWRKKFKKKGRTLSFNLSENYREKVSDGLLQSTATLYERDTASGNLLNLSKVINDQQKLNENTTLSLSSRLSYTEPLSKVAFLELNYSFKVDNNTAHRETFNKNVTGDVYDRLDTSLSNNYTFNIMTHSGGSSLRFMFKKINFSFGGSVTNAGYLQKDLMYDTSTTYSFTNFFPRANFQYSISKQTRIRFNYNGYTRQPTMEQIQPLRNNLDPLNISIGNAALTQEFNHNFSLSFNDYKMLTNRYIWASASISLVDNAISRTENVDLVGRRTYQYINVDGNYNGWGYVGFGTKIKSWNLDVGINANTSIRHINNIVNGQKNVSNNNSYSAGLNFNYNSEDEKLSISFNPEITYNDNKSSINTQTTSFWTTEQQFDASYELPLKFEIGTDINWYIRQQTSVFDRNNNVFRWNAYVAKKLLKNDQLELRMSVFDILNQNLGFNRYAQNNYVTEDNYNTIRRYGMLSLTWNFTKSAAGLPPADGNAIIVTP